MEGFDLARTCAFYIYFFNRTVGIGSFCKNADALNFYVFHLKYGSYQHLYILLISYFLMVFLSFVFLEETLL